MLYLNLDLYLNQFNRKLANFLLRDHRKVNDSDRCAKLLWLNSRAKTRTLPCLRKGSFERVCHKVDATIPTCDTFPSVSRSGRGERKAHGTNATAIRPRIYVLRASKRINSTGMKHGDVSDSQQTICDASVLHNTNRTRGVRARTRVVGAWNITARLFSMEGPSVYVVYEPARRRIRHIFFFFFHLLFFFFQAHTPDRIQRNVALSRPFDSRATKLFHFRRVLGFTRVASLGSEKKSDFLLLTSGEHDRPWLCILDEAVDSFELPLFGTFHCDGCGKRSWKVFLHL